MKKLALTILLFAASAAAQVNYVPRPVGAFTYTGSSWIAAMTSSGATPIGYVPEPVALYCSNDGTGNKGTWVPATSSCFGGGGGSVNVNGSSVSSPNFNATTPAATAGNINATFQVSSSSVSAQVPAPYSLGAIYAIDGGGATTSPTVVATNGAYQSLTLSGNTTIAFTQSSGYVGKVTLQLTQAAGGNDTVTWTSVQWPSGIAPVMTATANAVDLVTCILNGTVIRCTAGQSFQ